MKDWSFYAKCTTCRVKKFFIRRREVNLPNGMTALSQIKMCDSCYADVKKVLATNKL